MTSKHCDHAPQGLVGAPVLEECPQTCPCTLGVLRPGATGAAAAPLGVQPAGMRRRWGAAQAKRCPVPGERRLLLLGLEPPVEPRPHGHSPGLETPDLQLPWVFSRCAPHSTGAHAHRCAPPKMHVCTRMYVQHSHLCTRAHTRTCTHTCKHMHPCAHKHVHRHPQGHPHTQTHALRWVHPGTALAALPGSGPRLQPPPAPLVCLPGANSRAAAALIPDFKPFSHSSPLNRNDSGRRGRWMRLLLM